jgi:hypothetical protein
MRGINDEELQSPRPCVWPLYLLLLSCVSAILEAHLDVESVWAATCCITPERMHGCEIYGYSTCPRWHSTHICFSLSDWMNASPSSLSCCVICIACKDEILNRHCAAVGSYHLKELFVMHEAGPWVQRTKI